MIGTQAYVARRAIPSAPAASPAWSLDALDGVSAESEGWSQASLVDALASVGQEATRPMPGELAMMRSGR